MRKLQSQGVHHITLVGADRQTSIDFWRVCSGCRSCSSSPTSISPRRAICISIPATADHGVHRRSAADPTRTSTDIGTVHHIAFAVSRATFQQAVERLDERRIRHSGVKDRGFMDSIYFTDPLGL